MVQKQQFCKLLSDKKNLLFAIISLKENSVRILQSLNENTGFASLSPPQKTCVLGACSIYLPFPLTVAVLALILLRFRKEVPLRTLIGQTPGARWIIPLWILSIVTSLAYQNWLGFFNALGIVLIFLFMMLYVHYLNFRMLETTIFWWILLSIPAGLYGMIQYLVYSLRSGTLMVQDNPALRVSTLFFHTNLYATLLVMVILMCMYCFIRFKGRTERLFLFSCASFNFFMLLLTGCRSALLPFLVVVPVFFWADHKKTLVYITLLAEAMFAISILFIPDLIPRLNDVSTVASRVRIWQATLDHLPDCFWFGMGPQAFALLGDATKLYAPHAHNIFLDSLLCYGITGTLCIGGYLTVLVRRLIRADRSRYRLLFSLVLCVYLAMLIQGSMDVTLDFPATGLMFLLLINALPPFLSDNGKPGTDEHTPVVQSVHHPGKADGPDSLPAAASQKV